MAKLETLIDDIYSMLDRLNNQESIADVIEPLADEFAANMRESLIQWATPQQKGGLRMSNIGRKDRQLYFDIKSKDEPDRHTPNTHIKFLYGHLLEQVALLLCKAAGHEVTDEQKEVDVDGIKGHMDSKIDGEVVDVKTASNFSFQKFQEGRLSDDDPFGYNVQLATYEHAEGTDAGGFLVLNKESGELCLHIPEDLDKPNVQHRIEQVKALEALDTPPDFCYPLVDQGKSGNKVISRMCNYCPHKMECYKDSNDGKGLRIFKYSDGLKYFAEVLKEPNVEEIK